MEVPEFDRLAEEYYGLHSENIVMSGETPEYFAEYKIKEVAAQLRKDRWRPRTILDFGSGIGNSVPYFRKYFPISILTCADVSQPSLGVSRRRHAGCEHYVVVGGDRLPFADDSFDLIFSACVFHHVPHEQHARWLRELNRVATPNARLFIFEHNPLNPLTTFAVRTCPFDKNACLIEGRTLSGRTRDAHWSSVEVRYRVFFPRMLRWLRSLEPHLGWIPFGAQYYVIGQKKGTAGKLIRVR